MAARLKPLAWPLVLLVISFGLIYTCYIDPDPEWRYPKAEAAGPIFAVIGVPWLLFSLYRAAFPYKLAVGTRVMFMNGKEAVLGFITQMEGDSIAVKTEHGSFTMNRYEVTGLVWVPKPGDVVRAHWPDGSTGHVQVGQVQFDQVYIRAQDGREMWMPMEKLTRN
ncbi:MAG: hypothetical protein U0441_39120 [Polyangiaceae bacterium]